MSWSYSRGCHLDLFSDGRGQELSHCAEESSSNLLGMRSVLPSDLARLRQRVGARAAPRRAVRRRLVPVGYRPASQRRQPLRSDVARRDGRTLVVHLLPRGAGCSGPSDLSGAPSARNVGPRSAKPRAESAGLSFATHRGARRPIVAGLGVGVSEDSSIGQPSFHEHEIYRIKRLQLTPFSRLRQDASVTKCPPT